MRGLLLGVLLIFAVPFREPARQEEIKVMFWNVENYFDPFNDEKTDDDEFVYGVGMGGRGSGFCASAMPLQR